MNENLIDRANLEEHYVKKGDPSKPTYYIIRPIWPMAGLFAHFVPFCGHIRYALSKGWLPVIDMQNYPNAYLSPEKVGKENSWEYYFEQPLRIGLEQAYNGENIILNKAKEGYVLRPTNENIFKHDDLIEWRMLVKLGLLKVKDALMKEILMTREKLFSSTDRVLGVKLRGTDYVTAKNHATPPSISLAVETIKDKLQGWHYKKFFLATEDKNILKTLKDTFGDLCVTFDKEFVDYVPGKSITSFRIERENDFFLQGKDYVTEIILLSMCDSLIVSQGYGTIGVMMFAEKFKNVYAFNLGRNI